MLSNDFHLSILLVEDNPGDACLLAEFLKEIDALEFSLCHVQTLAEATEKIRSESFDIILLDLSLPDSQGFETFCKLRDVVSTMPIILLTGYDDESLVAKALNQGAQDYLVKGKFDSQLLWRSLYYAVERHRMLVELKKARALEQHLAYHDALTDLPNRLLFSERLEQSLVFIKRYNGMVAVCFLDLDGFKEINDRYGHAAGDKLLKKAARRIKTNLRESDSVARLGGDEFVILLKGIKDPQDASKVAEKLLRSLSQPYHIDSIAMYVTCSIGISIAPRDGCDVNVLLRKADVAMYSAKRAGKNTSQLFSTNLTRAEIENASFKGTN